MLCLLRQVLLGVLAFGNVAARNHQPIVHLRNLVPHPGPEGSSRNSGNSWISGVPVSITCLNCSNSLPSPLIGSTRVIRAPTTWLCA